MEGLGIEASLEQALSELSDWNDVPSHAPSSGFDGVGHHFSASNHAMIAEGIKEMTEYRMLTEALAELELQKAQAEADILELEHLKQDAIQNPISFAAQIHAKSLSTRLPKRQTVREIPSIDMHLFERNAAATAANLIRQFSSSSHHHSMHSSLAPSSSVDPSYLMDLDSHNWQHLLRGHDMDHHPSSSSSHPLNSSSSSQPSHIDSGNKSLPFNHDHDHEMEEINSHHIRYPPMGSGLPSALPAASPRAKQDSMHAAKGKKSKDNNSGSKEAILAPPNSIASSAASLMSSPLPSSTSSSISSLSSASSNASAKPHLTPLQVDHLRRQQLGGTAVLVAPLNDSGLSPSPSPRPGLHRNAAASSSSSLDAMGSASSPHGVLMDNDGPQSPLTPNRLPSLDIASRKAEEYRELMRIKKLREQRKKELSAKPSSSSSSSSSHTKNKTVHHGFRCDSCGCEPIVGNRWTCVTCPQANTVDFCDACSQSDFSTPTHNPRSHKLRRIAVADDEEDSM